VEQTGLDWQPWKPEKLTVRQVTSRIRRALRESFSNLTVTGEVSGLKAAASGHLYFNLKEEDTVLPCAMYRQSARLLRVPLRDGLMIEARGSVDVYEPRGAYQFLVESAQPLGAGALQQAFEELKQRLATEGLFDASRKRPLPSFPRRIGIITSPTGAVIQDMLNVLSRRCPGLHIRIYPALVQGAGSAEQLTAGLAWFGGNPWAEVVVLARGGGSLEDLWSFNDEGLARAIAACPVPVVSAVGHETDFTIADFAADLRAPTPSAAAELIVPDMLAVAERLASLDRALARNIRHSLSSRREQLFRQGIDHARLLLHRRLNRLGQSLDDLDAALLDTLAERLSGLREQLQQQTLALFRLDRRKLFAARRETLAALDARLSTRIQQLLTRTQRRHESLDGQLRQLNPLKILARGFSVVTDADGQLISSVDQVNPRDRLAIRVHDGSFSAQVLKSK
jgi:exodeoxyribonuclease VII large subunit